MEAKLQTKEEIISFLESFGIKPVLINVDKYGFSREIKFEVYGQIYVIDWWINQSYLHIGNFNRSAQIPFKYLYLDTTFPLVDGNRSLAFADEKLERKSTFDREYPFAVFRIPIDLELYKSITADKPTSEGEKIKSSSGHGDQHVS